MSVSRLMVLRYRPIVMYNSRCFDAAELTYCLGCFQVTRFDLSVCPQCDWFTPYSTAQEAQALPCMTASLKQNRIY